MFSVDALCKGFDTNVDTGLTEEQAKENLKKYGPNKMKNMPECTMVKRDNEWKKIMTEDFVISQISKLCNTPRVIICLQICKTRITKKSISETPNGN